MVKQNGNRPACAACRHQRKKCNDKCVLAPFFPSNKTQQYEAVHKVFGFSNIAKMLTNLSEYERKEAIESFEWEAMMWKQDPIFGPLGAFKKVRDMITQLLNQQQQQLIALTQGSSPFNNITTNEALGVSNNLNWAPQVSNNVVQTPKSSYQEKDLVSYPYVFNNFRNVLQNEAGDPEILAYDPVLNALASLQQRSLQSDNDHFPRPGTVLSSAMDQSSQIRDFQYYNENKINGEVVMQGGGQGSDDNVENIYSDGHVQGRGVSQNGGVGQTQQDHEVVTTVENNVTEGNVDHTLLRSQITESQNPSYYPLDPLDNTARIKQEYQHCLKQHKTS